jgi:spermidine synthase
MITFHENDLVSLYLSGLNELENIRTDRQAIQLYAHPTLGKVLVINGEIQHIENYQCLYHEMLTHFPMSFIQYPQHALIIGGGSLFAAYEILKYSSITKVVLCDYDPVVITLMEKHYTHVKKVLTDNRFHYINEDARQFLETSTHKYDLIVNDCFNIVKAVLPSGVPLADILFEKLTQDGVCSDIIYRYIFDQDTTTATIRKMRTYCNVCFSLVTVPEYPGVLHLEALWGKNRNLVQTAKTSCNPEQKQKRMFQYYNPDMLPYYLYLPEYIKALFKE